MEFVIELNLSNSALYYRVFFILAFALSFLLLLLQLKLNNRLNSAYLTAIAFVSLLFVIGCKLIPFLDFYFYPPTNSTIVSLGQMTLGGIILGLIGLVVVTKFLHLSRELFDYYGFAILSSLALQKFGCLFAGCCYGHSEGIFQVSYVSGISHNALPLYQIIAYFVIIFLLLFLKRYNLKPGILCYVGLVFYSTIQFIVEFDKLPAQTLAFADLLYGLKILQWLYLLLLIWGIEGIYLSARKIGFVENNSNESRYSIGRTAFVFIVTILLLLSTKGFLYRTEVFAVNIALIPALVYITIRVYQRITIPKYRVASVLLSMIPLFLMSQTVHYNDSTIRFRYHSLGFGFKSGDAQNRIIFSTNPGSCSGTSYSRSFDQSFALVGIGYSYTKGKIKVKKNYEKVEFGLNASIGKHTESYNDLVSNTTDFPIFDINPVVKLNSRWVGVSFGAHIGNVSNFLIKDVYVGSAAPKTGTNSTLFIPQFSFRFGPSDIIFMEYSYANKFISSLPDIPQDLSLGSGLGFTNGFNIRVGTVISSANSGFVSAYIPIQNKVIIEPLIRFGNGNTYMIGANYRFGKGTWVKKAY